MKELKHSKTALNGDLTVQEMVFKVVEDNNIERVYGFTDPETIGWQKSEQMMLNYGFKKIKCESEYNHYILNLEEENNGK